MLPPWLQVISTEEAGGFGYLEFRVNPPEMGHSLAVTLGFKEISAGTLRLIWQSEGGTAVTLASNLYEGTGLDNQRTVLIAAEELRGPGRLILQSDQPTLGIWRIQYEWGTSATVQTVPGSEGVAYLNRVRIGLRAEEISGKPIPPVSESQNGRLVKVRLTEQPERIEEGVEYAATLVELPKALRVEGDFAGLRLEDALDLWVNGRRVGSVNVGVPSLEDPGFRTLADGSIRFGGWRHGTAWVPAEFLKVGENTLLFSPSKTSDGIALKNLLLQAQF